MQPGVLVLNASLDVLYMNHEAQELCRELNESRDGHGFAPFDPGTRELPIPTDLSRLLKEVGESLALRADAKDWGQVYLRRTWDHRGHPLVLQAFGIPDAASMQRSVVIVLLEERKPQPEGEASQIAEAKERFQFTTRELAVAEHLAGGLTNKEIATTLGITEQTIKVHVKHIMEKTEATTRTAVLAQLFRAPMQPLKERRRQSAQKLRSKQHPSQRPPQLALVLPQRFGSGR
jgi:DNA-binding CsgD family transcriptional regulator